MVLQLQAACSRHAGRERVLASEQQKGRPKVGVSPHILETPDCAWHKVGASPGMVQTREEAVLP